MVFRFATIMMTLCTLANSKKFLILFFSPSNIDYLLKLLIYRFRSSYSESKFFEIKIPKDGIYYWNVSQLSIRLFDEDY